MADFVLADALATLPPSPGVYVFKDRKGAVLYVGTARSLRSRVRSYFQPSTGDVRAFIARLEAELAGIETFVTQNEKEAALLENQLIKREQPRYNVKLRDDKEFLTLRLDPNGQPIPTYTQETIVETAKVFTGWGYANSTANATANANLFRGSPANYIDPMMLWPAFHDVHGT